MNRPPITRLDQGMAEMPDATPDTDGWITWGGGECPVPGDAEVKHRLRAGNVFKALAGRLSWKHFGSPADIIAYRLVTPAPAPAPDPRDEEIRRLRGALKPLANTAVGAEMMEYPDHCLYLNAGRAITVEDVLNARAALASTPAAPERDGEVVTWQPIKTAPKDGTKFLAYQAGYGPDIYPCWWHRFVEEEYWQDDLDSEPAPTHWMPLPAAPAGAA